VLLKAIHFVAGDLDSFPCPELSIEAMFKDPRLLKYLAVKSLPLGTHTLAKGLGYRTLLSKIDWAFALRDKVLSESEERNCSSNVKNVIPAVQMKAYNQCGALSMENLRTRFKVAST
jgi:hypothetical protein